MSECPRCSKPLSSLERGVEGVPAWRCAACGGHWFERGAMERLEETVEVTLFEVRHVPGAFAQSSPLPCPSCGKATVLGKVQSEHDRKVLMDVCARCGGTWLDGGELEAIRQQGLLAALISAARFLRRS